MAMAPETRDGRTRLNQEPSFMATSTLVRTLNAALRDGNAAAVSAQLGSLRDPNVLLELANDDWVKEADVHLDPLILMAIAGGHKGSHGVFHEDLAIVCRNRGQIPSSCPNLSTNVRPRQPVVEKLCQLHKLYESPTPTNGTWQKRLRDEQDCTRNPQTTFWRLPETPSSRSSSLQQSPVAVLCRDPLVHNALFTGHLDLVRRIFTEPCIASACMDCAADQEHGESKVSGLWPLPSQRVHTTPACITASRGYEACLRHLLERGADPEAAPGGECALHCACEGAHQACVQLLLEYGARPNSCSEPGLTPLHMCIVSESLGCAERLLAAGARLQEEASLTGDTPLHTASTHGLVGHVNLYLSSGAHVDARNARGETPLHVACMSARGALDGHRYLQDLRLMVELLHTHGHADEYTRHNTRLLDETNTATELGGSAVTSHGILGTSGATTLAPPYSLHSTGHFLLPMDPNPRVCDLLLTYGATVDAVDAEMQTPLLRACVNVQSGVVRRLLNAGADPNARGYCGVAPLQKVLQMADYRPEQRPERLVQDLLNHGAIKFWPGALHKVLSHTCASVSTVEVLLNGYNYFKVTKAWRDAVPEEVQQANKDFYRSLFALSGQPRRLQHLARCALRSYLGAACHRLVPALPIPAALRSYLLLEPQGIMH